MTFPVLEAIRDGIAECIDAVTIPHEQRDCVDLAAVIGFPVYYPALVIPTKHGGYLDLIVYDGKIALTKCEEFAGEFYFGDPEEAEFIDYEAPACMDRLADLLAPFDIGLTR